MREIKDYIDESLFDGKDDESLASGVEDAFVKEFIEKHLVLSDDTYTEEQFQEKYGYEIHGDVLKLFTKKKRFKKDRKTLNKFREAMSLKCKYLVSIS